MMMRSKKADMQIAEPGIKLIVTIAAGLIFLAAVVLMISKYF